MGLKRDAVWHKTRAALHQAVRDAAEVESKWRMVEEVDLLWGDHAVRSQLVSPTKVRLTFTVHQSWWAGVRMAGLAHVHGAVVMYAWRLGVEYLVGEGIETWNAVVAHWDGEGVWRARLADVVCWGGLARRSFAGVGDAMNQIRSAFQRAIAGDYL